MAHEFKMNDLKNFSNFYEVLSMFKEFYVLEKFPG